MRELIDRQEAIDRFNVIRPVDPKKDEYTKGIDVGIAMCIVAVKDQPTIQPVATDTNVGNNSEIPNSSDAVSRQAAIDALDCINGTEEVLRSLPPAQHERKRGKWLADNRPGGGFWVCSCCKFPSEAFAANVLYKFCPNCGADMRGEQNG